MFNKVIIVGNLTRDVELRYLNTGAAVATIGLASNRRYKKADGMQVEDTCFVDVTLFGRTAEVANQYLRKGSKILIEGRLNFETWSDQHGNKRSKHTIVAENMQMLDTKQNTEYGQGGYEQNGTYDSGYGSYGNSYQRSQSAQSYNHTPRSAEGSQGVNQRYAEPPEIDVDEEIPF